MPRTQSTSADGARDCKKGLVWPTDLGPGRVHAPSVEVDVAASGAMIKLSKRGATEQEGSDDHPLPPRVISHSDVDPRPLPTLLLRRDQNVKTRKKSKCDVLSVRGI